MSEHRVALRALVWKDARLVLPLVLLLPCVGVFLVMLWSLMPASNYAADVFGGVIPILLPALFAAGAGAILVGQEKDQRTLWWMASLPVPPRRLIVTKLAVALVGLAVMWLACAALMWLVGGSIQTRSALFLASLAIAPSFAGFFWVLHSVFVLCAGFLTAWKFENVFVSLIAIVPLTFVPFVVVQVWLAIEDALKGLHGTPASSPPIASLTITALAIAVTAWWGFRVASARLRPAEPPKPASWRFPSWREAWRPTGAVPLPSGPLRFSFSSLLWQSLHHSRGVLGGLAAMIAVGAISLAFLGRPEISKSYDAFLALGVLVGLVAVSWLGVFAFAGDGSAERLRFLAERGVSPTLSWFGRHLVGAGLISLAMLLYAWLSLAVVSTDNPRGMVAFSVAMVAILAAVIYAFSQAVSHWIRILGASAFVAPVLSGVAVWWLAVAAAEMAAPLWLLLLTACLPLASTWLTMRTFMDGGRWWPLVVSACGTLLLVAVIPAVPLAVRVVRFPQMKESVRRELAAEAAEASRDFGRPMLITLAREEDDNFLTCSMSVEVALQFTDRPQPAPADWLRPELGQLSDPGPATIDRPVLVEVIQRASYAKVTAASASGGQREPLMRWIDALTHLARRLRRSPQWDDQLAADDVEIWLTMTLSDPAIDLNTDSEVYQDAVKLLADREARNAARRRAVLVGWHVFQQELQSGQTPTRIGGVRFGNAFAERSSLEKVLLTGRYGYALVGAVLELLERSDSGQPTEPARRRLHDLICGDSVSFEAGPYSKRLRGDDALPPTISIDQTLKYPANQWGAAWERIAESLAPVR